MSRFRVDLRSDTVTKPVARDAQGDGRGRGRRRLVRRRPDGEPPAGARGRGARHGGRALRPDRHDGATRSRSGSTCTGAATWSARSSAAHVATTEVMTSAVLSGIAFRTVDPGPGGGSTPAQATALLEPDSYYDVEVVDLLSVENTVGGGGRARDARRGDARRPQGRRRGRRGRPPRRCADLQRGRGRRGRRDGLGARGRHRDVLRVEGARRADRVAPVRPGGRMPEARRLWILFGGAWRQAGIMAAAGIVALDEGPQRLHEDHERARRLAEGVARDPARRDRSRRRLKRTWCSSTRKRWGSRCSRRSNGSRPSGWA